MKKALLSLILLLLSESYFSQLLVTPTPNSTSATATNLANYLLGSGVTISNAQLTCRTGAAGTFSTGGTATNLGMTNGVVLSTGLVSSIPNSNVAQASTNNGTAGIPQMAPLTGTSSNFDGCLLEFDIVPLCSPLNIRYKFGSEEYPEYVNMGVNDGFGFFINGPNPGGGTYNNFNLATVPGSGTPITIDNVNSSSNSAYYQTNLGTTIVFDGMTTVLTGSTNVTPCANYHLILAITDGGDAIYDSGVFLEKSGISCVGPTVTASSSAAGGGGGVICANQSATLSASGATTYSWSTGATSPSIVVSPSVTTSYTLAGSNIGVCMQSNMVLTVTVNPAPTANAGPAQNLTCAQTSTLLSGSGGGNYAWSGPGIVSGGNTSSPTVNQPGTYTLIVTQSAAPNCSSLPSTVTVSGDTTPPSPTASSSGTLGCTTNTVSLNATGGGSYSWSGTGIVSGGTSANPIVNGTGPYVVTVTAANGCTATASTNVPQNNTPPSPTAASPSTLTCSSPTVTLNGTGGGSYSWSGTGIVSGGNSANPVVNGTGPYVVTVTAANGCTATASTNVAQDITPPTPTASNAATLTCIAPTATLTGTGGGGYSWSGTGIVSGGNTANPIVNGTGPYVLTVTAANGCTATVSTNVAQDITPPTPTASNTTTLTCITTTASLTGTGGGGYSWSGTGIVSGGNTANPIVNGTGPYVVTVTAANGCTATASTNVPQDITPPTPAASNTATLTCITTTASLTGTGGGGYNWSGTGIVSGGNTANPIVNGTGPYVLTVTAANGCTATASTSVPQNTTAPSPTASSSGPLTCANTTITLTGTSGGSYVWSGPGIVSGGTTATPSVNLTGSYDVTVTAANGCTATANTTVTQNTATPTVTMPATQTITCASPTVSLIASANPSNSSPVWTGGACAGATTYTASACSPGAYVLTVTDPANGCVNSGTVDVVPSNGIPSVTLAANGSISCITTTVEVTATTTMTPVSYAWSGPGAVAGSTTPSGTVTVGGTYQCVVTNTTSGCSSTITTIVPTNTAPVAANVSPSASLTCITNTVSLTATPTGTNYVYNWSGPGTITNGTTENPSVNATGNYVVTITNNTNGCVGSFTVNVPSNTAVPTLSLSSNSLTTSCSTPTVTLNASSNADPGSTYSWTVSAGGTLNNTTVSNPIAGSGGLYEVAVTNTVNGCVSAIQSVSVTADANIPTFTLTATSVSLDCITSAQTVTLNTSSPDLTYAWSPAPSAGGNTITPTFNTPGVYSCVITNTSNSCSTGAAQVTVTSNTTAPSVSANNGILTCATQSLTITSVTSPTTGISYTWNGPGIIGSTTGSSVDVNADGTYDVLILDAANGCTNTASSTITSNTIAPTLALAATSNTISCASPSATLTATPSVTDTPTWSTPGGPASNPVIATVGGDYIAMVTDASNGCSTQDTLTVTGNTVAPTCDAGSIASMPCGTPTISLNGTTTATDPVTYNWSGPNAGSIISASNISNPSVMDPGVYTLTVTNSYGCSATATVNVSQANVTASFTANPTSGISPLTVNFTDGSTGATGYSWNFGDSGASTTQNPSHIFTTGTYTVILTVTSGPCSDTASVVISVEDPFTLEIPNVFTPNGDGSNDIFTIKSSGIKEISLQIFNRWGQKLYEFSGPKASWDGLTPQGGEVPEGTYFYFVKATGFDDSGVEKNGTVNLFR